MTVQQQVYRFLAWWRTGLLLLLPESLRRKLNPEADYLTVEASASGFLFHYYPGGLDAEPERQDFSFDNAQAKTGVMEWLDKHLTPSCKALVLIDISETLCKSISLPLAGEMELRELLGFEMDRQTPFSADQVYYDSRVVARDVPAGKLRVEWFILPRRQIDPVLAQVRSLNLQPGGICVRETTGINTSLNLLDADGRRDIQAVADWKTRLLFGTTAILLLAMLYVPLLQNHRQLETLEGIVEQVRSQAAGVQPLVEEREHILARRQFLSEKRADYISTLEVLSELSDVLPDDTWANRLTLRNREVQINGESAIATQIIQILEARELFHKVQFRSPVTKNTISDKDRFHVSAELREAPAS